jgi:hypothetical protein
VNNPVEVQKLQVFLTQNEGESLENDGAYNSKTIAAVKRFQSKHLAEILAPWGITQPTGSVYHTTKKKINELYCAGERNFDLTEDQVQEINSFRGSLPPVKLEQLNKGKVGDIPTPSKDVLAPLPANAAVPVLFEVPVEEPATSSPTSLFKKPVQWISSWLLSALPIAEALSL